MSLSYANFLETLSADDRQDVKSFFENNFERIENNDLHFSPYQNSIQNVNDFYAKIDLAFSNPEPYGNAFMIAERLDDQNNPPNEVLLYIPEKKGFYYQSPFAETFKVADSFSELLNKLGLSEMTGGENLSENADEILDSDELQELENCYGKAIDQSAFNFYREVFDNDSVPVDRLFPDYKENENVVYERGDFNIRFPFKPLREDRLGFPVENCYIFGHGTGGLECGDDEGFLVYNANNGGIYRYEYLWPFKEKLPWWHWRSLLGFKRDDIFFVIKIAVSFNEFLTKLEQHGWKPIVEDWGNYYRLIQ